MEREEIERKVMEQYRSVLGKEVRVSGGYCCSSPDGFVEHRRFDVPVLARIVSTDEFYLLDWDGNNCDPRFQVEGLDVGGFGVLQQVRGDGYCLGRMSVEEGDIERGVVNLIPLGFYLVRIGENDWFVSAAARAVLCWGEGLKFDRGLVRFAEYTEGTSWDDIFDDLADHVAS